MVNNHSKMGINILSQVSKIDVYSGNGNDITVVQAQRGVGGGFT